MADLKERPDDLNQSEQWQWAEAEFCDIMVKEFKSYIPGWLERGDRSHPSNFTGAYDCAVKAQCWGEMARHLRQTYYARKENEAYHALSLAKGETQ